MPQVSFNLFFIENPNKSVRSAERNNGMPGESVSTQSTALNKSGSNHTQ